MSRNRRTKKSRNSDPLLLFRFGLLAAAIALVAALVLQNISSLVTISFLGFATIPIPLSFAIAAAFVSGAISAYVVNLLAFWLGGNRQEDRSERIDRSSNFDPSPPVPPASGERANSAGYNSYVNSTNSSTNSSKQAQRYTIDEDDNADRDQSYAAEAQSDDDEIYYETNDQVNYASGSNPAERSTSRASAEPPLKSAQPRYTDTERLNDDSGQNADEWVDGDFYGGRTRAKRDRFSSYDQPSEEEMLEYPPKQRPDGYDQYFDADQVIKEEPKDYLEAKYIRRGDEED